METHLENYIPVIALDGHAGAGKSTVADMVAQELGFIHVNTGALYRALTWKILKEAIPPHEQMAVEQMAHQTDFELAVDAQGQQRVKVGTQDVTDFIRTPEINQYVSPVSAYPGVREVVNRYLQHFSRENGIVMDGRDIGTVVFPNALLKIFLTASVDERARRQYQDAQRLGQQISLEALKVSIEQRDKFDSEREAAPLRLAEDAILLDTTELSQKQVVERILSMWQACKKIRERENKLLC